MYYKLDDKELEAVNKASSISSTDYDLIGNLIPAASLVNIVEDLLLEITHLEEKIEDMEEDIKENYRPIPESEQYGISDRDFM